MATIGGTCENVQETCTIEATVPTGFESVAAEEAKEMFQTDCKSTRGRITFQTPAEKVKDILKLGGIDHCRAQVLHVPYFGFTQDAHDCLSRLQLLVKKSNWEEGLSIWSKFYSFDHLISHQPDKIPTDEELIDVCYSIHMPGNKAVGEGKKKNQKDKRKGKKAKMNRGQKQAEGKNEGGSEGVTSGVNAVPEGLVSVERVKEESEPGLELKSAEAAGAGEGHESESKKGAGEMPDSSSAGVTGAEDETVSVQVEQHQVRKLKQCHDSGDSVDANEVDVDVDSVLTSQADSSSGNVVGSSVDPEITEQAGHSSSDRKASSNRERKPRDPSKPAFRVTCKRAGENHCFDSMSAAASFGSAVQTYFGWHVDMTNFDIEVVLSIDNNEVSVGLALTPESLHKRNLVAFGVTTLRPTICHNMLRMAKVCPGHIVCDPLCGTGSISIQGALSFPAFQLCGDNHNIAMEKTQCNKDALNAKRAADGRGGLMMDALQWNTCYLPLRDGIVDVFVSDLPFGKRLGRRYDNLKLYCNVLDEMARCGKLTGRAALLTGDMNNMMKAIQGQKYWLRRRCYSCNIGGIAAGVFLLYRTMLPYLPRSQARTSHESVQHQPPLPTSDQNGSAPSTLEQDRPEQSTSSRDGAGESLADEEDFSSVNEDGAGDCAGGVELLELCPSPGKSRLLSTSENELRQPVGDKELPSYQGGQQTGVTIIRGSEQIAEGDVPRENSLISEREVQALCQAAEGDRQLEKDAENSVAADLKYQDTASHHYHFHHHHHHHFHHHYHRDSSHKHDHLTHGGHHGNQGHYDNRENLYSSRDACRGKREGRHYRDNYHGYRDGHTYYSNRNSPQYGNRDGFFGNKGGQHGNRGGHYFNRDSHRGNRDGQDYGGGAFSDRGNAGRHGRGGKVWKKSRDWEEKENFHNTSAGDNTENRAQVGNVDENQKELLGKGNMATLEAEGVREALKESRASCNANCRELDHGSSGNVTEPMAVGAQFADGKEVLMELAETACTESGVDSVDYAHKPQTKSESSSKNEESMEGADVDKEECYQRGVEMVSESP